MARIKLPFLPKFQDVLLCGVKTMTCRTKRYGAPGDLFEAFGATFKLTHVMRMPLWTVAVDAYKQEGCVSPEAFLRIWIQIHPRAKFQSEQLVWAHCFQRQEGCGGNHETA